MYAELELNLNKRIIIIHYWDSRGQEGMGNNTYDSLCILAAKNLSKNYER